MQQQDFQQSPCGSKTTNAETISPGHSSTSRMSPNSSLNLKNTKRKHDRKKTRHPLHQNCQNSQDCKYIQNPQPTWKKACHLNNGIRHEKNMYTDQTGKFPYSSSWVNRYHIVIHDIYSNSAWVKPIKDITEVVIMLGRTRALKCMKLCGIRSKRQVLDNKASQVYKDAVQESGMIYQLVPPDYHWLNIS